MLTKRDLFRTTAAAAMAGAAGWPGSSPAQPAGPEPSGPSTPREIGEAGFIYGLPMVLNYLVMSQYVLDRRSGQWKAPFNRLHNEARVFTDKDTKVLVPNNDTPYSMVWADLRAEPLVLTVPPIDPKRYFSVMLCDAATSIYGYIGSRTTGNGGGTFLVAGPEWTGETPPGIKQVFRSGSSFSLIVLRTQLFAPADLGNVRKVQAGYRVHYLSRFLHKPRPPRPPRLDFPPVSPELAKTNFLEYLDFALRFIPARPEERNIRAQLARLGVGTGKGYGLANLPVEDQQELALGLAEGSRKVTQAVAELGVSQNGWRTGAANGDAAFFGGDWLARAAGARAGIYGNAAEEALYPLAQVDADGQPLDGGKHAYTLTFPPGQLPPVKAFWSLTLYDARTRLLVGNPLGRFLINSPMLPAMKRNAEGSLTILIQNASPGAEREANWLPAPAAAFYLALRLYWPDPAPPSALPAGKGTWQPPAVVRAA